MSLIEEMTRTGLEHLVLDTRPPVELEIQGALIGRDRLPARFPIDRAAGAALFSPCRTYRYALTRTWDEALPPAVFIMLNPSTADAFKLDPTVRRCQLFAEKWGAGGLVVLNAFALRSTDPKVLRGHADPVGPANDSVIVSVLCAGQTERVIVAWGCDTTLRRSGRDDRIRELLYAGGFEPHCLGQTRDGFPRHPLYVRGDTITTPYPDGDAYGDAVNRAAMNQSLAEDPR